MTDVAWIADDPGSYQLELDSCEKEPVTGQYQIRVEEKRLANKDDSDRVRASQAILRGDELQIIGTWESSREAIREYETAAGLWHAIKDPVSQSAAVRKTGGVLQVLGERSEALQKFEQALALIGEVNRAKRIEILNHLCSLHTSMGDYKKASTACAQALNLSRASKDSAGEAQSLSNKGMTYYELGDLRNAVEHQKNALRLWERLKDRRGQAQSLLRMGYAELILGNTQDAFGYYQRSLALAGAIDDHVGKASVLTALGHLNAVGRGRQEALNYYNQALTLAQQMRNSEATAEAYSGMGYVYYQLGDYEQALKYREKALELYQTMADLWGQSSLHLSVGRVYRTMNAGLKAISHFEQGLSIARSLPNAHLESAILREIGTVYEQEGETSKALEHYQQSLAISRRGGDSRDEAEVLNQMGGIYLKVGRKTEALNLFARALPLTRTVGDTFAEALTVSNIAQAQSGIGNLTDAKRQIEVAINLVESLRTNVASQDLRASFFSTVRRHYELYIDILMKLHQANSTAGFDTQAFDVSERARARSFLELLRESRAGISQDVDAALLQRSQLLQQTLNAKAERHMQLLAAHNESEAKIVAGEIDSLTAQYEEVTNLIKSASPRYEALAQSRPLKLAEVQQQLLEEDSLLLEYALGDERSYLWAVTRDQVLSYQLPGRAEIEAAARNVYDLLIENEPIPNETFEQRQARVAKANEQLPSQVTRLSKILLAPVASQLASKRLLIVADGTLQYIPFQILTKDPDSPEQNPLVADHEIVNQPSASALALLLKDKETRKPASKTVAVLADPVFEADDSRIDTSASPGSNTRPSDSQDRELQRAVRDVRVSDGGRIPRLWASGDEAEAIMSAVPWRSGFKATGFEANRATAMRSDLRDYGIVHFATHGFLNDEHPELSGIVLSLYDQNGRRQDGFLRLHDIYNLKLPVDLVVLSACSTGLGKDVKGEGLIGLTRGFMYAGAGSVVASLWKVNDEATAELMGYFYRFMLKDGLPPAAALRQAQIKMSQQKRWHSPYYWAGFVIQGQYGETVKSNKFNTGAIGTIALLAAVAAAVLGLTLWFVFKRRPKQLSF